MNHLAKGCLSVLEQLPDCKGRKRGGRRRGGGESKVVIPDLLPIMVEIETVNINITPITAAPIDTTNRSE